MRIKTLSVSEVNNYIKRVMDDDFILSNLSVKGEISNLKFHSSGHIYFALKDSMCRVNCVMFKSYAVSLNIDIKEGMEVVITGYGSLYAATGSMQIYCSEIKKPLPSYPKRIGVVTSSTGAVIKDIINVSRRRNIMVDIVLYPARVQGINAYKEIISGIEYFNKKKDVDLIIVGRGGGSIEELWNFNEEKLADAVFKSRLPIISAVGHETDFTICDFVSDVRASTPSQAAEMAVPLYYEMIGNIKGLEEKLETCVLSKLKQCRNEMESLKHMLTFYSPLRKVEESYVECDRLKEKLDYLIKNKIESEKAKLINLNNLLSAHNPINVMKKGYVIIEDENKTIIRKTKELKHKRNISIRFEDGYVNGEFIPLK